jgi:hypothetical protein
LSAERHRIAARRSPDSRGPGREIYCAVASCMMRKPSAIF